jgi:hypothetical protein
MLRSIIQRFPLTVSLSRRPSTITPRRVRRLKYVEGQLLVNLSRMNTLSETDRINFLYSLSHHMMAVR